MKPYYHTFEWKDRVITLCFLWEDDTDYGYILFMGYSVKLPIDKEDEKLAKIISLGRAKKESAKIWITSITDIDESKLHQDKGVLKAIARNCERNIKDGNIVIKGIR